MNANVGGVDRFVRLAVGVAVIGLGVAYRSWWGALGVVPLVTAAVGWCPLYAPFGIRTCPAPRAPVRG
jgi:hypothetical protein